MMDEKHIDLIQQELDGVNDAQQSAELKECCEADSEVKDLYDQFVCMDSLLCQVDEVQPAPSLKQSIMCAVLARACEDGQRGMSWRGRFSRFRLLWEYRLLQGCFIYFQGR